MQLLWPMLAIATFVICLQIQGRHKEVNGVSLMVSGSLIVMIMSLVAGFFQFMVINGDMDYSAITAFYSLRGMLSLVGQVLFLIGLYNFGMARKEVVAFDDLLDDLPD